LSNQATTANLAECYDLKVDRGINMEKEVKNKTASIRAKLTNIAREIIGTDSYLY